MREQGEPGGGSSETHILPTPRLSAAVSPALRELEYRVHGVLLEKLAVRVESSDSDLLQAGFIDSMGFVQLVSGLEERFDISLPLKEVDIDAFMTVARIARMIESLKQESASQT